MTHYEVLGVAWDADAAEVRRAYLALARRHHPDHVGGDPDRMRAVNEAWATLGDPDRRRRYDLALQGPAQPWRAGPWAAAEPPDGGADDLDDDRPYGDGPPASGWFAVVPVALFAASVALGLFGLLMNLPFLVGTAAMLFALSCLAFVAAPLLALSASRRRTGASGGHRAR